MGRPCVTDMTPPVLSVDARCRTFAEQQIVEHLVLHGFAREVRGGGRVDAERECRAALERWVSLGLPFARSASGARTFDPNEVVNMMKWTGARCGDPFWEQRFIEDARERVCEFHDAEHRSGEPPAPSALAPRRVEVTLRREFDLTCIESGARTLLRMPLPLEDAMLGDLAVAFDAPPGADAEVRIAPGRLDARMAAPTASAIALAVRMSFTLRPGLRASPIDPLSIAERELYTQPAEGLVRVTPRVQALAGRLAGAARNEVSAVRNFWNFVVEDLACGMIAYEHVDTAQPLEHVLDTGWFDCQMGTALLVALCRSRSIPARVVSGYLIYPTKAALHWWAEVWLHERGWIPLDTMCTDLSVRGRDAAWHDYFFGQVDYRMKCECLPRHFNRTPGLRLPDAWRILTRADGDATEIGLYACDSGAPIYRDRLTVRYNALAESAN